MEWLPGDKESYGLGRYLSTPSLNGGRVCQKESPTSVDNSKREPVACDIFNCSSSSARKLLWPPLGDSGRRMSGIGNSPDPRQRKTMFGRKTPESESHLNSENDRSDEIARLTGNRSEGTLNSVDWTRSLQMYTFAIILPCAEYGVTLYNQLLWSDLVQFSGARLGLGSRIEPGEEQAMRHILKIRVPSSGAATKVKILLYSMNLEELSMSLTSSGGLTSIRSAWRLKEEQSPSLVRSYTSRRTCTPPPGTPNSIETPMPRWNVDSPSYM